MALPPCGIYQTTQPLAGHEEHITAGQLIYFHNHSEKGPPLLLLPEENTHNRWAFESSGHLVEGAHSEAFIASLVSLPREGLYVVQERIETGDDESIPPRTLVQVGYNPSGHVILFPAELQGNGMSFPEHGVRFEALKIFDKLARASFDPPEADLPPDELESRMLH